MGVQFLTMKSGSRCHGASRPIGLLTIRTLPMEPRSLSFRNGQCFTPLQRAQNHLLQARQFLCAGCKRDCERRLAQFGASIGSCPNT